jgi:hypothetical protein
MVKTTAKKEAATDVMPIINIWEHIERVWEKEGSCAAITELERITGENDKLFLTNQIFIHCL